MSTDNKYKFNQIPMIIAPVIYLAVAVGVVLLIASSGEWPSGTNVYYYIYRGNLLYNSILNGNYYPLVDLNWYNGFDLVRAVSQLEPYVYALFQYIVGGNQFDAYLLYVGCVAYLDGLVWLFIGHKENKPWLGAAIGLVWFFVPSNLSAIFIEGALARGLTSIFMPLLIYAAYSYLERPTCKKMLVFCLLFIVTGFCHIGFAGMIAIALIVFFLIYSPANTKYIHSVELMIAMFLSAVIMGFWLIIYFIDSKSVVEMSETMTEHFQSIWITLNPLERINGWIDVVYFGLSFFLIAVIGLCLSDKNSRPTFATALLLVICSSNSMYGLIKPLPGSSYLWMTRFFSILVAFIFLGILHWKNLRKRVAIVFCILMVLDIIPSLNLVYRNMTGVSPTDTLDSVETMTMLDQAKSITKQRLCLMDLTSLSSEGGFIVSGYKDPVKGVFGSGWETATTADNIVQLNRALETGEYLYLFDRALELGSDTVLIDYSQGPTYEDNEANMEYAATLVGYSLVENVYPYALYHYDNLPSDHFGVVSDFKAVGIGTGAPGISLQFPSVEETDIVKLDDYTFEDLAKYDLIYLAGFSFDDREYAEDLILKLSEAGVKILISADGIPEDRRTHDQSFLGVRCNAIVFTNGYPELDTIDGIMYPDLFPQGYATWNTVYMEGLSNVWGTVYDNDLELAFFGTGPNDNIIYIGLNLPYYYGITGDKSAEKLLSHAMDFDVNNIPQRTIVPLDIKYERSKIIINSDYDDVNTTIAYHEDLFKEDSGAYMRNNLTYVDKGTTVIELQYPYMAAGFFVSILGMVLLAIYILFIYNEIKIRYGNSSEQK